MQGFFQAAIGWLTPIFVISAMLNVGLTQKPANIFQHLRNWQYPGQDGVGELRRGAGVDDLFRGRLRY